MSTTESDIRPYEFMVIFSGGLTESDFVKELDALRRTLKEQTKGVSREDVWGRRNFTYRMKKQNAGYYAVFNFTADPKFIAEFRGEVKLNPVILRHLLITVPQDYDPNRFKNFMLRELRPSREEKRQAKSSPAGEKAIPQTQAATPAEGFKVKVAGAEEEKDLKRVEKKLEEILDNPDIEIK